jgi:chorismate-pyruvate lyase
MTVIENNLYRIVRRANSEYVTVATIQNTYLQALKHAEWWQENRGGGEYLVREITEADWAPGSAYQSGMDWL